MPRKKSALKPPFLKRVALVPEKVEARDQFPYDRFTDILTDDFEMVFDRPVTFFIGENGSGKTTFLRALAEMTGFQAGGGRSDHQLHYTPEQSRSELASALRGSWLPKVSRGFFFRADTYNEIAHYTDHADNVFIDGDAYLRLGIGKRGKLSHGEAFMDAFDEFFETDRQVMFFMDEPETALSPMRQMELLSLMYQWETSGNVQMVMATHSPLLMSYPGADLRWFDGKTIEPIAFEDVPHVRVTKGFLANPGRHLKTLFDEGPEAMDEF